MAGVGQPAVKRLRAFLGELQPGSRALLIAELERSLLRGEEVAGSELVLSELRRSFRNDDLRTQRSGEAARAFFQPLEPFLVNESTDHSVSGRICRATLEPLWSWIVDQLEPEASAAYAQEVEQALREGNDRRVEELSAAFQDRVLERIREAIATVAHDEKARRKLGAQTGAPRGLQDVQAVTGVLGHRDALAALGSRWPGHLAALSGAQLESAKSAIDACCGGRTDLFRYGLVLLMDRLASPWQLIRLATRAANSDAAARIAETPYALAVGIVLAEIERMARELETSLKSGRGIAVGALLKAVHDAVRGLRSELDLASDSPWGRQLAGIRALISQILTSEIETVPGRVRRLLRPRQIKDIGAETALDADEVAEVEGTIGFLMACRNYASELAVNEVTLRTLNDLQQNLDIETRTLLDALRSSGPRERPFRQSQIDAAVRFCARVFGQEYAVLLTKAAEVAGQSSAEPKAARA